MSNTTQLRVRRRAGVARLLVVVAVVAVLVAGQPVASQEAPSPPPPPTPPPTTEPVPTTEPPPSTTTTTVAVETTLGPTSSTVPDPESPPETEPDPEVPTDPGAPPEPLPPVPPGLSPDRAAILEELRGDFEGATADELSFFGRLLAAQTLAENLQGEIEVLDEDLATLEAQMASAQAHLDEIEARLAQTRRRLAALDAELGDSSELLQRRAVDAYVSGGAGRSSAIAFLRSGDANEADRVLAYSTSVLTDQQGIVERYRTLRDEADGERRLEEAEQAEALEARDAVAARRQEIQERRNAQERARAQVMLSATETEGLLAEASQRRSEFERRMAAVVAVSDGIAGTLAALQGDQRPPPISTGIFIPPIRDMRVTSPFGPRMHPIYGVARMHNGMDVAGATGTPIRAAGDGVVVFAEPQGGYGLTVVIDHGNTLGTLYAHMSSFAVLPGDVVKAGDVVGGVGSTGLSTGPHLHFEVRILGQPLNPLPYVGPER